MLEDDYGIGKRIRERRIALQMTQEELATKVGYKTRASVNQIELNARNLTQSKIMAFAKALDTTPSYIMGWDQEKQQEEFTIPEGLQMQLNTRLLKYIEAYMKLDKEDREEVDQIIEMKSNKAKYKNNDEVI